MRSPEHATWLVACVSVAALAAGCGGPDAPRRLPPAVATPAPVAVAEEQEAAPNAGGSDRFRAFLRGDRRRRGRARGGRTT